MIKDGIINIYKDQGMTSHDVCHKVKKLLGVKKAGHTGTLDPMATGVLPICVGRATRVMQFMESDRKMYRCEMTLGLSTDTYDIWGEVTGRAEEDALKQVTEDDVKRALDSFIGEIEQIPPKYSAVKVKGKRLYEYARKGRDVEIPVRKVVIDRIDLIAFYPGNGKAEAAYTGAGKEAESAGSNAATAGEKTGSLPRAVFDVWCSKGTFIRSICRDAGEMLGTHAVMSALERRQTGIFSFDDAVRIDELKEMSEDEMRSRMKDPDSAMGALGIIEVREKDAIRLVNGLEIEPACYEIAKEPENDPHSKEPACYKLAGEPDGAMPATGQGQGAVPTEPGAPEDSPGRRLYRVYSRISADTVIPGRPDGIYEELHPREDGLRFIGVCDIAGPQDHLFPGKIFI